MDFKQKTLYKLSKTRFDSTQTNIPLLELIRLKTRFTSNHIKLTVPFITSTKVSTDNTEITGFSNKKFM